MAESHTPDANNVPGGEGNLPQYDPELRRDQPRDDPAGVGADRDGTDEAEGNDPLHPEQRRERIDDSERGPEDLLAGGRRNQPQGVDDAGQEEPRPAPDPNDTSAQSAKRTDETDADKGTPPNEAANPEAHEGI